MRKLVSIVIVLFFVTLTYSQSHYPGQHSDKIKLPDRTQTELKAFELKDVKLLDSPFQDNMLRSSQWIFSLPVNSLLHSFRTNAGVYSGREGGYMVTKKLAGWESLDCELRGHSTGHILSALSLFYAATGEEKYKLKGDSIIDGLAEVQDALKQNGYLSAYPQNLIDRNIAGKSVWAPWYTLHKLFSGLIDQYLNASNDKALEIVMKMSNWAYLKLKDLTPDQRKLMLRNEFGGMNDSFYNLYAITGNPQVQWLAEFFYHEDALNPLKQKEDNLNHKHANTFIPKLIGLVRDHELKGNDENLETADFFWHTVVDHHAYCTGSNSDKEHFFLPDQQSEHLTGYTGESCNVYNMLKLTRHLFCVKPEMEYADYYEKALFNHILGQQDDSTGMISYFLPMMSGAHKVYSTRDSSFWCCVGTGFENQSKFSEAIYYKGKNKLVVNLFIPSELYWEAEGLKLKQETVFPENGKTVLTIEASNHSNTTISVRYPSWAIWGATFRINGKLLHLSAKPGTWVDLNRKWEKGDRIEVEYNMELHLAETPDNPERVAIMYGPIVLAGKMGKSGMEKPSPFSDPKKYNDYYTYNYHIPDGLYDSLNISGVKLKELIRKKQNELKFQVLNNQIELEPLYKIHRQRYVVYWNLKK